MSTENQSTHLAVLEPAHPLELIRPVAQPDKLLAYHKEVAAFVAGALEAGTDYMQIPGTGENAKSALTKAGSERLVVGFGCVAEFEIMESEALHNFEGAYRLPKWVTLTDPGKAKKDELKAQFPGRFRNFKDRAGNWVWQESIVEEGTALGLYRYVVKCKLLRRDSGEIVGTGVGSCSTMESKYIRAPRESENTVLKMAKKRAQVDAVLGTFGLSDRFTQDVEEKAPKEEAIETEFREEPAAPPMTGEQRLKLALDECGLDAAKFVAFRGACKAKNEAINPNAMVIEAWESGARSLEAVYAYAEVELDAPKPGGPAQAPAAEPAAPSPTAGSSEPPAAAKAVFYGGLTLDDTSHRTGEITEQQVKKLAVSLNDKGVSDETDMRVLAWGLLAYAGLADESEMESGRLHGLTNGQASMVIDWSVKSDADKHTEMLAIAREALAKRAGQTDMFGQDTTGSKAVAS